ncbi:(2Fe-2S)-binding protein [Mycolicibacterium sp. S2-37]|uniref:(2Fe-2S)-binding protein n=1 Tax=Mycolicibacterium sp. S2-37 TaxID=2810297 RepID=UPI001A94B02F|nr:(2Fe-2S)-binding protein [Mycolicibacterium sp. S2-37]MBO0680841.1 (2Fe-2S)-binding protein [Mycolicibacterium sp. S2-37]
MAPRCLADRHRTGAALRGAATFGPYFAVLPGTDGDLLSPADLHDPRRLGALLRAVGRRIGSGEARVAASTLQYGLAARLWSVVLGAWSCGGVVVDVRRFSYVVTEVESVELALAAPQAWYCASLCDDDVAERIAEVVIAHQNEFHDALRSVAPIAEGLLWGNAASALASAARTVMAADPGHRVGTVTAALLARAPLAGRLVQGPDGGLRRLSCCLWYRTTDRDNCGDCPLIGRPVSRQPH